MADAAAVLGEVKGLGDATRAAILERFPSLDALAVASRDDLTSIKGVGPATADAIAAAVGDAIAEAAQADVASEPTPAERAAVATAAPRGEDHRPTEDADVIPLRRVRDGVQGTAQELRGVLGALRTAVGAAIDAGRAQLPEVRRELGAAAEAVRETARTIVAATKESRHRG